MYGFRVSDETRARGKILGKKRDGGSEVWILRLTQMDTEIT